MEGYGLDPDGTLSGSLINPIGRGICMRGMKSETGDAAFKPHTTVTTVITKFIVAGSHAHARASSYDDGWVEVTRKPRTRLRITRNFLTEYLGPNKAKGRLLYKVFVHII